MKTYAKWKGNLHHYLEVGDLVDKEMKNYFLDVMPPAHYSSSLIQMGEPYDHVNGKPIFETLKKTKNGWKYCGHCFRGENK